MAGEGLELGLVLGLGLEKQQCWCWVGVGGLEGLGGWVVVLWCWGVGGVGGLGGGGDWRHEALEPRGYAACGGGRLEVCESLAPRPSPLGWVRKRWAGVAASRAAAPARRGGPAVRAPPSRARRLLAWG